MRLSAQHLLCRGAAAESVAELTATLYAFSRPGEDEGTLRHSDPRTRRLK
jgi:hypothetical protein